MVQETIQGQAKGLLAADIAIKGSWEQGKEDLAYQTKTLPTGTEFLFIKELHGMAQYKKKTIPEKIWLPDYRIKIHSIIRPTISFLRGT